MLALQTEKYVPIPLNSLRPSDAYMRQWTRRSLVQIMGWLQTGAKSLSEPMMEYCQFETSEQTSVRSLANFVHFHSRKCICKRLLRNRGNLSRPQYVTCGDPSGAIMRCRYLGQRLFQWLLIARHYQAIRWKYVVINKAILEKKTIQTLQSLLLKCKEVM